VEHQPFGRKATEWSPASHVGAETKISQSSLPSTVELHLSKIFMGLPSAYITHAICQRKEKVSEKSP
jgi:hypothetical protein